MVLTRQLVTENYGIFALLVISANFLLMIIDFGSVTAVTQLIASSDDVRKTGFAHSAILFRVSIIPVFSIFVYFGRNLFNLIDSSGLLVDYIIYIPLMLFSAGLDLILTAILQGKHCYRQMAIAQILRSVFRLGLTILFLYFFTFGIMAPIYSWILSHVIAVAYEYLVFPFSKRFTMDWRLLRKLLRFGFPLQLNNFLWFASTSSQSLLLSIIIGPSAVAFFEVASRIPNAILRLSQAYTAVFFPTITELLATGKRDRVSKLLNHSLTLSSFFVALIALISVVFSRQLVTLIFSERYAASGLTFSLLMIAVHMAILSTLMGYSLTAAGFPGRSLGVNFFREAFMLIANLVLIPNLGFVGPAYAKILAFYLANPVSVWLIRKSEIKIVVSSYVKQTGLLWLGSGLFWVWKSDSILLGLVIVIGFIIINMLFSTITFDDLSLIMPESIKKKFGRQSRTIPSQSIDG